MFLICYEIAGCHTGGNLVVSLITFVLNKRCDTFNNPKGGEAVTFEGRFGLISGRAMGLHNYHETLCTRLYQPLTPYMSEQFWQIYYRSIGL